MTHPVKYGPIEFPSAMNRLASGRSLAIIAVLLATSTGGCLTQLQDSIGRGADASLTSTDFLTTDQYRKWIIEIDYAKGFAPSQHALDFAAQRLASLVNKPDGIEFRIDQEIPVPNAIITRAQADNLHDQWHSTPTSDDVLRTHILYLDGEYEQSTTLGFAVGHKYISIFAERIQTGCDSSALCLDAERVEAVVLTHELGHIIGLVNNGIPMVQPHEHPDAPRHSNNRESIMWPETDTTTIFALLSPLGMGLADDFDAADRADVCISRGRCPA
jgi:hypothetical protein